MVGTWTDWLRSNPKDFLETSGLITGTIVTASVAFLTFRLYQLNEKTLEANSRQNNQNILGAVFEDGMLSVDKTMTTLSRINTGIQIPGDFYPNEFTPKRDEVEAQRNSAEKFGLRLDLYGVTKVSYAYKAWLLAMIEFMTIIREIQDIGQVSVYGQIYITDTERKKYAPKLEELTATLIMQKLNIMSEMSNLVAIN